MSAAPALFHRHRNLALAISRDYFLPGAEREDVQQEALIALWEAARAHDPAKGPFRPFAHLVIHRRLQAAVTAANRGKQLVLTEASGSDALALRAGGREPFEVLWEWEELRRIRRGAKTLTERQAKALAQVLNGGQYAGRVYDKAVDNAVVRARAKLRAAA